MYSTHKKGRSVVAEKFMRTFESKNYKKGERITKKSYLGYLDKLLYV